jgi:hypothetical protein
VSVRLDRCRSSVHETLYPFARPSPVAYLPPDQGHLSDKLFGSQNSFSGWFRVLEGELVRVQLSELGASAYSRPPPLPSPDHVVGRPLSSVLVAVAVAVAVAFLAAAIALRYRGRRRVAT